MILSIRVKKFNNVIYRINKFITIKIYVKSELLNNILIIAEIIIKAYLINNLNINILINNDVLISYKIKLHSINNKININIY